MDSSGKQLIAEYLEGPRNMREAVADLSAVELDFRPGGESWTIREIIFHLCDSELVGSQRMRKIVAEDHPTLRAYDQGRWVACLNYEDADLDIGLDLFVLLREYNAYFLRNLPEEVWERRGRHEEHGLMTLRELVRLYIDHVSRHLKQVGHIQRMLDIQ